MNLRKMLGIALPVGIVLLLVFITAWGSYYWKPQDNTISKEYPQYLLVIRYWGGVSTQEGGLASFDQGWVYLNETYDSLDEVLDRLNTYTGSGLTDMNELVGLWKLGEDRNEINKLFRLEVTEHSEPVRVEERKWKEYKWEKK